MMQHGRFLLQLMARLLPLRLCPMINLLLLTYAIILSPLGIFSFTLTLQNSYSLKLNLLYYFYMRQKIALLNAFRIPAIVVLAIVFYLLLLLLKLNLAANLVAIFATLLGSYRLFYETVTAILKKNFALDYIAILAIVVSLATQEYLVAIILALMISSGRTLEDYGVSQAKKSLRSEEHTSAL